MTAAASLRRWLVAAALIGLGGVAALALQRHFTAAPQVGAGQASPPAGTAYAPFTLRQQRPAFTPEEEAYAAALWPIHSEVKDQAVKLTFAGLAFKLKEADAATFKQKLQPLQTAFDEIGGRVEGLHAPASMAQLQENYAAAMALYRQAVAEMLKAADDGADQHLLSAQEKTSAAGQLLLKVGNTLWPTEYKPN